MTQPLWLSILWPQERGILPSTGASLNVSENVKLIEYLMFLHDGNCLMPGGFHDFLQKS